MDGFLRMISGLSVSTKGGAWLALPFVLLTAVPAHADVQALQAEAPHLDGGIKMLQGKAANLDNLSASAGFPATGGTWWLYGGGATITPGPVRAQAAGWTGSLEAVQGTRTTQWHLALGVLTVEQRYPMDQFLVTAGSSLSYGELNGAFLDGSSLTAVRAPLFGWGLNAGVRWPARTKLGFMVRGGWDWLSGDGQWKGTQGAALGGTHFELGGPTATAEAELSF